MKTEKIVGIFITAIFLTVAFAPMTGASMASKTAEVTVEPGISGEEIYQWGMDLTRFCPVIPGTVSMELARDYVLNKLREFGLDAWVEPYNFWFTFYHDWGIRVLEPEEKSITCYPQVQTGLGDVTAELVDVGKGKALDYKGKDVEGKIVLVNWGSIMTMELPCGLKKRYPQLATYDVAWTHGAAGLIGYFEGTPGNSLKVAEPGFKPTGGSNVPGAAEVGPNKQIMLPVLGIGRQDAMSLKSLINKGPVKVRLFLDGVKKVSTTWTVIGRLPGKTDDIILVGSHLDTPFNGAVWDDISGVIGTLGIAKYFSQLGEREKTMLFVFDPSHVWVNCNQAGIMIMHNHPEWTRKMAAVLWLDNGSVPKFSTMIGEKVIEFPFYLDIGLMSANPILWLITFIALVMNGRIPLALPITTIWTMCMMGVFDRNGVPAVDLTGECAWGLTTEDTMDKFTPGEIGKWVNIWIDIASSVQKIPGWILRAVDLPGPSLFGCGVLFHESETPDYPAGDGYLPEPSLPLYVGGYKKPVLILRTPEEKIAYMEAQIAAQ